MRRRLRINGFDLFALAAVIVSTFFCIGSALDAADLYMSVQPIKPWKQIVGCLGWLVATFGPITLAVYFWRKTKQLRAAWALHMLFLPCAFAALMAGDRLMLFAAGVRDFDATIGGPVIQAALLSIVTPVGYFVAVLSRALVRAFSRAQRPLSSTGGSPDL
jgi:hypothetical protein